MFKKHGIILCACIVIVCVVSMVFYPQKTVETNSFNAIAYVLYDEVLIEYPYTTYKETREDKIIENVAYLKKEIQPFQPLLKDKTLLEYVQIVNKCAVLCFSMLDYEEKNERKVLESLIYACTQFDDIKSIQIKINNEVLQTMPKTGLSLQNTSRSFGINAFSSNQLYLHEGESQIVYCMKKINNESYYMPRSIRIKEDIYDEKLRFLSVGNNSAYQAEDPLVEDNVNFVKKAVYEDGILHVYANKKLNETCKEILKRSFLDEKAIAIIKIHVNNHMDEIVLRNS